MLLYQANQHVPMAWERLAVAAQSLAHKLGQGGDEVGAVAYMDLVHLDHFVSGAVPADPERVSPLRWPGYQNVVRFVAEVHYLGHAVASLLSSSFASLIQRWMVLSVVLSSLAASFSVY